MLKYKITHEKIIKFIVILVLMCTYIIPTGIIDSKYQVSKIIFSIPILIIYIINLKRSSLKEWLLILVISFFVIYTKDFRYIIFLTLPFLNKIIENKEFIIKYINSSNILYICLGFTFFYSIIFWGTNGRYAFTAIKEINQSGLAIFCLGVMLMKKNKKIGILTLFFGLLTISRSYFIAIILYFLSNIKFIKRIVKNWMIKFCNYINLTILSNIGLIILGVFYLYQYKIGNIYWGDDISTRLYTFLDYSNFFRFVMIIILLQIFIKQPKTLLFGMETNEYISIGKEIATEWNIPYKYIVPHNLFFSHLKIYGVFSFVETFYINSILRKIVNKNNIFIYLAIFLYSVLLGAGLYSYWLYLTVFTLLLYEKDYNGKEEKCE